MRNTKLLLIFVLAVLLTACSTFAGKEETGVVIARRAQVRSSTAVVAADIKEVVRGDVLNILASHTAENGEQWLRVRMSDADAAEGWIEARNVLPQEMLERSRQIAKEDEKIPAQSTGQLRASTNIRFSPQRSGNDNILMKLESGAQFEIVGWKRVPKPKTMEAAESDDAPKSGTAQQSQERSARAGDEQDVAEDADELWYKVRLPPAFSPAPAGWILGKQVELTVPSDIIFYRTGREFVAWQKLDGTDEGATAASPKDKDAAKDAQPGSWVILEKSSSDKEPKTEQPDFDRIFVLGYDKERKEHYTAYRSPDVEGYLPLGVEGKGDDKEFRVRINAEGQIREARFKVFIDDRGHLKVNALDESVKSGRKK